MKLGARPLLLSPGTALRLGDGGSGNPLLGDGDLALPNLTSGLFGVPGDVIIEGQGVGARIYAREKSRLMGGGTGTGAEGAGGISDNGAYTPGTLVPNPNISRSRRVQ